MSIWSSLLLVLALAGSVWAAPNSAALVSPPGYPPGTSDNFSGSANEMRCFKAPADKDITNATILTVEINTGVAAGVCGVAVYPDGDGSTALGLASGACTATSTLQLTGITAFSLTGGTTYRWCVCSTSTTPKYVSMSSTNTGANSVLSLVTTFTATNIGTAANACLVGIPQTTTGALTTATGFRPAIITVSK